jgi:hypothetical protein
MKIFQVSRDCFEHLEYVEPEQGKPRVPAFIFRSIAMGMSGYKHLYLDVSLFHMLIKHREIRHWSARC